MADAIRFLLGTGVQSVSGVAPTMTVLEYLRTVVRRTGTKEGCAEGDCGACTVLIGDLVGDDRVRYRAVNACIAFLPMLDGKQLLTIEDLTTGDGGLHPMQQALIDLHGSQCGFCTPGIVMALVGLQHDDRRSGSPSVDDILDGLAGNLCRCTGYRPILDAARQALAVSTEDGIALRVSETAAALRGLQRSSMLHCSHDGRHFLAPRALDELLAVRADHPDAVLLAGGTDVGLWVTKQHRPLDTIVYICEVADLATVVETDEAIEIGAAATYAEAFDALAKQGDSLALLLSRLGAMQIRNLGTIGGNIANASPIGDSLPALIALGATITLASVRGRRALALEAFFLAYRRTALAPDEIVERITVPKLRPGQRFRTYKIAKRWDQDISGVCGAFAIQLDGDGFVRSARIAFGGMAATPKRAEAAEQALIGEAWDQPAVAVAQDALDADYSPIDDFRASAAYRRLVARNLLMRFYLETGTVANPHGAALPLTSLYADAGYARAG